MPVTPTLSEGYDIQWLKEQGRAFLKSSQVDKALRVYASILRDHPDDIDSLLILGDAYLIAGERNSALALYHQAIQLSPQRRDIERRISLIQPVDQAIDTAVEMEPSQPAAVAKLLQRLTGQSAPVSDEQVEKAGELLTTFLGSPSPARAVAEHLDEIDSLLPALIELNIRQARSDGRTDLADSLQALLADILLQIDLRVEEISRPAPQSAELKTGRILIAGADGHESPFRSRLLVSAIGDQFDVFQESRENANINWDDFDLVILRNPQCGPQWIKNLAARSASRKPVILDLDTDFEALPQDHPDFEKLGLSTLAAARNYQAALQLADLICVSNESVAEALRNKGYSVRVIADGWDQRNILWQKPAPPRSAINLGLIVTAGQIEDVTPIRRAIIRILREIPQTRLIVYGDLPVYQLFDSLPDVRRLFLPPADPEDYPYLLTQMDILMVPLKEVAFNQLKSDRLLMEAGARGIPWVASPNPSNLAWEKGGLIAYSIDEWYSHLLSLIADSEVRSSLSQAGYQKALYRENQVIKKAWVTVIQQTLSGAATK